MQVWTQVHVNGQVMTITSIITDADGKQQFIGKWQDEHGEPHMSTFDQEMIDQTDNR